MVCRVACARASYAPIFAYGQPSPAPQCAMHCASTSIQLTQMKTILWQINTYELSSAIVRLFRKWNKIHKALARANWNNTDRMRRIDAHNLYYVKVISICTSVLRTESPITPMYILSSTVAAVVAARVCFFCSHSLETIFLSHLLAANMKRSNDLSPKFCTNINIQHKPRYRRNESSVVLLHRSCCFFVISFSGLPCSCSDYTDISRFIIFIWDSSINISRVNVCKPNLIADNVRNVLRSWTLTTHRQFFFSSDFYVDSSPANSSPTRWCGQFSTKQMTCERRAYYLISSTHWNNIWGNTPLPNNTFYFTLNAIPIVVSINKN